MIKSELIGLRRDRKTVGGSLWGRLQTKVKFASALRSAGNGRICPYARVTRIQNGDHVVVQLENTESTGTASEEEKVMNIYKLVKTSLESEAWHARNNGLSKLWNEGKSMRIQSEVRSLLTEFLLAFETSEGVFRAAHGCWEVAAHPEFRNLLMHRPEVVKHLVDGISNPELREVCLLSIWTIVMDREEQKAYDHLIHEGVLPAMDITHMKDMTDAPHRELFASVLCSAMRDEAAWAQLVPRDEALLAMETLLKQAKTVHETMTLNHLLFSALLQCNDPVQNEAWGERMALTLVPVFDPSEPGDSPGEASAVVPLHRLISQLDGITCAKVLGQLSRTQAGRDALRRSDLSILFGAVPRICQDLFRRTPTAPSHDPPSKSEIFSLTEHVPDAEQVTNDAQEQTSESLQLGLESEDFTVVVRSFSWGMCGLAEAAASSADRNLALDGGHVAVIDRLLSVPDDETRKASILAFGALFESGIDLSWIWTTPSIAEQLFSKLLYFLVRVHPPEIVNAAAQALASLVEYYPYEQLHKCTFSLFIGTAQKSTFLTSTTELFCAYSFMQVCSDRHSRNLSDQEIQQGLSFAISCISSTWKSPFHPQVCTFVICACWQLIRQHYPHRLPACASAALVEPCLTVIRRYRQVDSETLHWALALLWLMMHDEDCRSQFFACEWAHRMLTFVVREVRGPSLALALSTGLTLAKSAPKRKGEIRQLKPIMIAPLVRVTTDVSIPSPWRLLAMRLLRILTKIPAHKAELKQNSVSLVTLYTDLLVDSTVGPDVLEFAAQALAELALRPENRQRILGIGGTRNMLQILRSKGKDLGVRVACLNALLNLSMQNSGNQHLICKVGLPILTGLLDSEASLTVSEENFVEGILLNLKKDKGNHDQLYGFQMKMAASHSGVELAPDASLLSYTEREEHNGRKIKFDRIIRKRMEDPWHQPPSEGADTQTTAMPGPEEVTKDMRIYGSYRWQPPVKSFEDSGVLQLDQWNGDRSRVTLSIPRATSTPDLAKFSFTTKQDAEGRHVPIKGMAPPSMSSLKRSNTTGDIGEPEDSQPPMSPIKTGQGCSERVTDTMLTEHRKSYKPTKRSGNTGGKMAMWQCLGGAVSSGLFPTLQLPDGSAVYLYHEDPGGMAAVEPNIEPDLAAPLDLADLGLNVTPERPDGADFLNQAFLNSDISPFHYAGKLPTARSPANMALGTVKGDQFHLHIEQERKVVVAEAQAVAPEQVVWDMSKCVFKERYKKTDARELWDTLEVKNAAFNVDWRKCLEKGERFLRLIDKDKRSKLNPEDDKVLNVKNILKAYYPTLMYVFVARSCVQNATVASYLGRDACMRLIRQVGVPDESSKSCKQSDIDTMFTSANFDGTTENNASTQHELHRSEFLELIIRMSAAKYNAPKLEEGVESLCELIKENLGGEAIDSRDSWRKQFLIVEPTDKVLRSYYARLLELFKSKCSKDVRHKEAFWTLASWKQLLVDAELLDDNFTHDEGNTCFYFSKMEVVDEHKDIGKYQTLSWLEFLEAIVRLTEFLEIPPKAELQEINCDSLVAFDDMLFNQGKTWSAWLMERDQESPHVLKSDPISVRLENVIELLFHRLERKGQIYQVKQAQVTEAKVQISTTNISTKAGLPDKKGQGRKGKGSSNSKKSRGATSRKRR